MKNHKVMQLLKAFLVVGVVFLLGFNSAEDNGNTANTLDVIFTITASDEDYSEIQITADADFFQYFESRQ